MRKNTRRHLFFIKMILITKQTKNNFITKPYKSLHHKLQCIIQSYTDNTQKLINNRTCSLSLDNNSNGRSFLPTNSWRALKQRILRTPELALVSLAGTRCNNNQVLVFRLSKNLELINKFSHLTSCIRPSYYRLSLKTSSLQFSLFPNKFLQVHSS